MSNLKYTDQQIAEMICKGNEDRNTALRYVYTSWRDYAKRTLLANGGKINDVEDAIQEAIVVLDNSLRNNKFQFGSSLKTYFIGICKGRLYSNRRSIHRMEWTDDNLKMDGVEPTQPETLMLSNEQKDIVGRMLNMLDETCRQILQLYRLSYSMAEIATEANLNNANNARQRVYKCRKRMAELATKNAEFAHYFNR